MSFAPANETQNPFERDCLFSNMAGGLTEPAIAQLDSLSKTPFCISLRYLKKLGKEHDLLTDLSEAESSSMRGRKVYGIVRNLAFRVKGTSSNSKKDFVVTDVHDDLVDVVFG